MTRYFARRETLRIRWSRSASGSTTGQRKRGCRNDHPVRVRPTSAGSMPRRVVSTSGNSGIRYNPRFVIVTPKSLTMLLGVDTGGTFTDFVLLDDGGLRLHKVVSTPEDPSLAIRRGITELGLDAEVSAGRVTIVHGSTVATNAALEGKGVRTAYVTNRGFTDVLRIGRQARRDLYSLAPGAAPNPVPDELLVGIRRANGSRRLGHRAAHRRRPRGTAAQDSVAASAGGRHQLAVQLRRRHARTRDRGRARRRRVRQPLVRCARPSTRSTNAASRPG